MLDDDEIEKINSRYNSRIEKFGFGIDALASGSEDRRNLRFKVLTEVGVRSGVSVLDVGCGLGDYYRYLRTLGLDVEYTGVDINSALVEECKKRYPDANFYLANIERDNLGKFDFVVSSSSFNLKITNEKNLELIESMMSQMYSMANQGVAVDMLTRWVDFRGNDQEAFYYDPADVLSIGKTITKRVALRHDYPLFEFCVYLYPDFVGWSVEA